MSVYSETDLARLWEKIDRSRGADSCWPWMAAKTKGGNGTFWVNGQQVMAHRAVYEAEVGPITACQVVLHLCAERSCCNPSHLALGGYADRTRSGWKSKKNPSIREEAREKLPHGNAHWSAWKQSQPNREERFWSKVVKTEGCWLWMGARRHSNKEGKGHGTINIGGGRWTSAHRFSYELHYGTVPDGLWVLHHCDNPQCVRPDHLFLGTVLDNNRDMYAKGRAKIGYRPRGEDNNKAKLTAPIVDAMKRLRSSGCTYVELGKRFGVSKTAARAAVLGKTWKHLKD